jgi:hypothetical protein
MPLRYGYAGNTSTPACATSLPGVPNAEIDQWSPSAGSRCRYAKYVDEGCPGDINRFLDYLSIEHHPVHPGKFMPHYVLCEEGYRLFRNAGTTNTMANTVSGRVFRILDIDLCREGLRLT